MELERERQAELFHDSWHRLSWVERQAETVASIAEPWMRLPRQASLRIQICEDSKDEGYLEFSVEPFHVRPLPSDVNFLIGNLVTDARSCLDMAVNSIWNHYGLNRKGVTVQFPLEDNFSQKLQSSRQGKQLRTFLERLDDKFVEVIKTAQPDYVDGMLDIPSNLSGIFISKLSNANKHRNITPASVRVGLSSYGTGIAGLKLRAIDSRERKGIPPLRFCLSYDTDLYSEDEARAFIAGAEDPRAAPVNIDLSQRLVIDGQEIPLYPQNMGGHALPWRAELESLITKVPAYIRLTLRNLNRAHQFIQGSGDGGFTLDLIGDL